ncbi:hypothetical protein OG339_17175 [Streptosporangium sp. NBC_01495]|uniref:hypothetical protein n=1 Tax=Streptosporangium sp. NBC_01495 TaxID=2903899 RepID=UPI002E2FFDD4|nr:hypothetical protein [Streptosporangium sp. NBC_01495]
MRDLGYDIVPRSSLGKCTSLAARRHTSRKTIPFSVGRFCRSGEAVEADALDAEVPLGCPPALLLAEVDG